MYRLLYAEGVEKHSAGTERRAHFYSPPPQDRDRLLLACLILTHACVCLFAYLPIYISGYLWPVVTRIGPSHRHRYFSISVSSLLPTNTKQAISLAIASSVIILP